ncbi:YdcF family protein [Mucilaginibacter ginsenosidivorax]|uniref:Uncharacterized protein n=1 Tax=Mucilaginibacter ginsenosidivorax TaxID=862126 RepID=A0A5B8W7S7_9SPHI|nr:hypothetical protein [Mucilaginibacter ginsenosidivorax]QEC78962.1 hypothetical protein FSB76_24550 [Mucilaginibacter ginsenosidivorax]
MIFKWQDKPIDSPEKFKEGTKSHFSFDELFDYLLYTGQIEKVMAIEREEKYRFFSDQIASLYRKLFSKGYGHKRFLSDTFLMVRNYLQQEQFEFLCFLSPVISNPETDADQEKTKDTQENKTNHLYSKNWQIDPTGIVGDFSDPLSVNDVFKGYNDDSMDIFFVFGCQNIAMLDNRVHTAAVVLADLLMNGTEEKFANNVVILSGWNNSASPKGKVQFANESLMMKNLLLSKVNYFLDVYSKPKKNLPETFATEQIITEIESRNTAANITGLFNIVENDVFPHLSPEGRHINLYLISSSPHLLEITEKLRDYLEKLPGYEKNSGDSIRTLTKKLRCATADLYLIGTDHPQIIFTAEQEHEVKLLINNTLFRNFKSSHIHEKYATNKRRTDITPRNDK